MTQDLPTFRAPDPTVRPSGPTVRELRFRARDDEEVVVRGRLLAFGTSEREDHTDHAAAFASKHDRCSACRWFEVSIAQVEAELSNDCTCEIPAGRPSRRAIENGVVQAGFKGAPATLALNTHEVHCGTEPPSGRYLVVTAGRTIVPDEMDFRRASFTDSPYEVIELLRVESARDRIAREQRGLPEASAQRSLPSVSARALAQAAAYDDDLRDAYLASTRA